MGGSMDLKRFERAADALAGVEDPLVRLSAIRDALARLESLEAGAVADARASGATWKTIGALYGLSKQGAQQRFRGAPPAEG